MRNLSGISADPVMAVLPDLQRCIRITLMARRRSVTSTWSSARGPIRRDDSRTFGKDYFLVEMNYPGYAGEDSHA